MPMKIMPKLVHGLNIWNTDHKDKYLIKTYEKEVIDTTHPSQQERLRVIYLFKLVKFHYQKYVIHSSVPVISSRSQQGSAQNVAHRTFPTVANEPRSMTQYPIQTGSAGNQSESGDVAGEELSREVRRLRNRLLVLNYWYFKSNLVLIVSIYRFNSNIYM